MESLKKGPTAAKSLSPESLSGDQNLIKKEINPQTYVPKPPNPENLTFFRYPPYTSAFWRGVQSGTGWFPEYQ